MEVAFRSNMHLNSKVIEVAGFKSEAIFIALSLATLQGHCPLVFSSVSVPNANNKSDDYRDQVQVQLTLPNATMRLSGLWYLPVLSGMNISFVLGWP